MEALNNSFKSTCRSIFGTEIGELEDLKGYLLEKIPEPLIAKSTITQKDVFLSRECYSKNSNFIELENLKNIPEKLEINEIKDLDSIMSAIKEKFHYCGNKNIGNSANTINSDSCQDGINILNSHQILEGKYIAYSHGIRKGEYVFGSVWSGEVGFIIKSQGVFFSKSCYESYLSTKSRNLYFSFNCLNCAEMIFCFNQISKLYCIGNIEFEKDQYFSLKDKLILEIAQEIKKNKTFPSLFEFCR